MPLEIEIKGRNGTPEHEAAQTLRDVFRQGIPKSTDGHIVIISGATLFGQSTKDIDLIAYGELHKFKLPLRFFDEDGGLLSGDVFVNNFCMCMELKRHAAQDVLLDGLVLKVRYNNKLHDVTHQSEKQKYALKQFIEERTGRKSPYVYNFVWLKGLSQESLMGLVGKSDHARTGHNYLPSRFSLAWLFQLACVQRRPFKVPNKDYWVANSVSQKDSIHDYNICDALELFTHVRQAIGDLTRKKIEKISERLIKDQKYIEDWGRNKLLVVSGRAGTGKTVKLLRLSYDLARNHGKRCLILTYNLALVSDIKRTLAHMRMPDDIDTYSVDIQTLHKFFYELAIGFGFGQESPNGVKFIADFIPKYAGYLSEMTEFINAGVIQQKDIQDLMESRHDEIAWDYVLVDEAQDWQPIERDLIYKLFTSARVIIADGIDQMIRSQAHCNWAHNVPHAKTFEKRCLRQKRNLVEFVNNYAEEFNLGWELDPVEEYEGGKVVICTDVTPYNIFKREYAACEALGNRAYEMMFLSPPSLVVRAKDAESNGERGHVSTSDK
ncbi:MAG: hypothetical protein A2502_00495 [Candidatus Edwardsbacteria bacterium RifOxyC12_full_54_24]|nr:MAG: hypothetical protein A2502_00495 [Candidatus Edwardsbacteria bacterium RifOxyC12_full_54_24]